MRGGERDRQTNRQTETETDRDRERDRQTDIQTQTDRERRDHQVCKAHRLVYHSSLGVRVIQKKRRDHQVTSGGTWQVLKQIPLVGERDRERQQVTSSLRSTRTKTVVEERG